MFPTHFKNFLLYHQTWNCRLQTLSIWKSPEFVVWERVKRKTHTRTVTYETIRHKCAGFLYRIFTQNHSTASMLWQLHVVLCSVVIIIYLLYFRTWDMLGNRQGFYSFSHRGKTFHACKYSASMNGWRQIINYKWFLSDYINKCVFIYQLQNKTMFLWPLGRKVVKTVSEKEKILVTSFYCFFLRVFS